MSYNKYEIMKAEVNQQLIGDKITLKKVPGPKDPYVRRSELQDEIKSIKDNMVTRSELQEILKPIKENMVTRSELQEFGKTLKSEIMNEVNIGMSAMETRINTNMLTLLTPVYEKLGIGMPRSNDLQNGK